MWGRGALGSREEESLPGWGGAQADLAQGPRRAGGWEVALHRDCSSCGPDSSGDGSMASTSRNHQLPEQPCAGAPTPPSHPFTWREAPSDSPPRHPWRSRAPRSGKTRGVGTRDSDRCEPRALPLGPLQCKSCGVLGEGGNLWPPVPSHTEDKQ